MGGGAGFSCGGRGVGGAGLRGRGQEPLGVGVDGGSRVHELDRPQEGEMWVQDYGSYGQCIMSDGVCVPAIQTFPALSLLD